MNFAFDHEGPPIRLLPQTRITKGERLLVDYYHGMSVHHGQVTACMSEPRVYEVMSEQAQRVQELLAPAKFMFSMDEIRAGGSCAACKQRGRSMGEILGDCITKQTAIVRKLNPQAEVFIWSDMLDPNHNAHGNYYLVDGAYYDADTLENPRGWKEVLDTTPGGRGIMYTTWQSKYALLGPFGDLLAR